MSSIDERVVKMEFDNAKFEDGVKESLNTIENLTVSLNKLDNTKISFDQIQRAAAGLNIDNIADSVDTIKDRFSGLGIVGGTVIAKLTNSAMDFVTGGLKSLTSGITQAWDTINTGGMQRARNIENAKFQIEGLGRKWEEVSGSINDAVEETAYGLDEAALAASQFLASGVKTGDQMTTALRSISGVAAMTNSGYSDIARIMTTIAGNGKVMTMQLNQLGMKGINAAATLRDYFNSSTENLDKFTKLYNATKNKNQASLAPGTKATEQDIRQMVTNGAIDFETFTAAMDNAYGAHAKDAQRTFEGASANVQAALKKIGAEFKTVTISSEDYDNTLDSNKKVDFTKTTFNQINVLNELRNVLKGLQADMKTAGFVDLFSDIYHAVSRGMTFFLNSLYVTDDTGKHLIPQLAESLNNLKGAFENVAGFVVGIASSFSAAWKSVFPKSLPDMILGITSRIKDFTDMLPRVDDIFGAISDIFGLSGEVADDTTASLDNLNEAYNGVTGSLRELVAQTINGDFGNGADRVDALGDSYQQIQDAVNSCYDDQWRLHEDWINNIDDTIQVGAKLAATEEDIAQKEKESADIAERSEEAYNGMMTTLEDTLPIVKNYAGSFEGLKGILMGLFAIVNIVKTAVVTLVMIIRKFVAPVVFRIVEVLIEIVGTIGSFIAALNSILPTTRQTGEALEFVADILRPLWNLFHWVTQGIIDFMRAIRPGNDPLGHLREYISSFIDSVTDLGGHMGPVLEKVQNFALGLVEKIGGIELPNGQRLSDVFSAVFDPIVNAMSNIADRIENIKFPDGSTIRDRLKNVFGGIPDYVGGISAKLQDRASGIFTFFSSMKERISEAISMDGTSIPSRIEYVFDPVVDILRRMRDKLSEVFAPLLEFLSPITSAISKLTGKIVDGLKGLVSSIGSKLASLPDMTKNLRQRFDPIIQYLKPFASTVKDVLGKIIEVIGSFIDNVADSIDLSKNPFQIIIDAISSFGKGIADTFNKIANSNIITSFKNFGTTVLGGLSTGVQSFVSGIQRIFKPIFDAIGSFVEGVTTNNYSLAFGDQVQEVGDNLETANDALEQPGDSLLSTLESFATRFAAVLPAFANSLLMFLMVYNIGVRIPKNVSKLLSSLTGGVDSITGFFAQLSKSLKKFTKAVDFAILAEGFKSLAVSLAILAGVVVIFGNMDWSVISQGLVGVTILMGLLLGMTALFGLISQATNLNEFGSGFLKIAGACLMFIVSLGIIMLMLGAETKTVNGETVTVYKNLHKILAAIGIMFLALTAILVPITAAVAIAAKLGGSFGDLGKGFIGIGIGLYAIVAAVDRMHNKIKEVADSGTWGEFFGAIAILVVIAGLLMYMQSKLSNLDQSATQTGVGFVLMSVGLLAVAYAIQMIAGLDIGQIVASALALIFILSTLIGMLYVISSNDVDMKEVGDGILRMAIAIGVLAVALMAINTLGENTSGAVVAMAALVAMLTLLAYVCGNAQANLITGGAAMLMMAGAIAILAAALFLLQDIAQGGNLALMVTILAAVTIALAALGAICAKAKSNMLVGAAGILVIAAALALLTAALSYLVANTDVATLMGMVVAIIAMVAVLGILAILAEEFVIGFAVLAAFFVSLSVLVIALAAALYIGGAAFTMMLDAMVAFSNSGVDLFGIAGGMVTLGLSLLVLSVGTIALGAAMIAMGAGALVASVGIGALAISMLLAVAVISLAVGLFQQAGQAIMDGLLGGILGGIGGVIDAIGSVASGLIGGFCSFLGIHSPSKIFQMFGGDILNGLKNGLNGGSDLGQMFGSSVGSGALDGLTSSFGEFDINSLVGEGFGDFDMSSLTGIGGDWMSSLGLGMGQSTEPIEVSAEKVQEAAASADGETEAFKLVGQHAVQWFATGMRDFDASSFYNSFTGENGLAAQMEQAINEIQFDSSGFYNAGVICMNSFLEGVNENIEQIKDRIAYLCQSVSENFKFGDLTEPGRSLAKQFISGMNTQMDDARTAGHQLATQAHDGASGVDMWWTGYWMASGFVNGIRSKIPDASSAGNTLATVAKTAAEIALRNGSPSKEMYKVGGFAGEGFVLGILSKITRVKVAGTDLADTALEAMSVIPDILDADPNLEPTITPVLDMSNIDDTLKAMSGTTMFDPSRIDSYFAISGTANDTTSAIASGGNVYNIEVTLDWAAGQDANQVVEELADAIDAKIRLEG